MPASVPILFFKALLPGSADLFAQTTEVAGYTTKDGTFVAPHRAVRHKRTVVVVAPHNRQGQGELFAGDPVQPAARPAPKPKPVPEGQSDLFAAPVAAPAPKPAVPYDAEDEKLEAAKAAMHEKVAGLSIPELRGLLDRARDTGAHYRVVDVVQKALVDAVRAAPEPNEDLVNPHGVYQNAPVVVSMDRKGIKAHVQVARTRWGYTPASHTLFMVGNHGGSGGMPQIRGPFFATQGEATEHGLHAMLRSLDRASENETASGRAAQNTVRAWVSVERMKLRGEIAPPAAPAPAAPARQQLDATRAGIERDMATLDKRWRSMVGRAEAAARAKEPGRGRFHGRHATTWTVRQEEWFQEALKGIAAEEAPDLRAIIARVDRVMPQAQAAADRLRSNEPWQPMHGSALAAVRAVLDGKGPERVAPGRLPARTKLENPASFGVGAGTSKKRRRELNAAAVELLKSKGDAEMTAEDRTLLAKYSGNGGSGDSLNEFYTPPELATAVWTVLGRAGFAGGRVLEPSAGTGVFLHTAPEGASVQAVELDPISSRINHILHGGAGHDVATSSLESFATQDGTLYDAVIGNPPFGPRGALLHDDKPDIARAEAYFLDTALDKVKDGGLVAFVLPSGVMDSSNGRGFREDVLRKAEFLGGSRLPNTAFQASHTDVTCDVLLFRKRPQAIAGALSTLDQDQMKAAGVWDADWLAGSYFRGGRGEGNVHGSHGTAMRAWGQIYAVDGSMQGVPAAVATAPLETPEPGPDMDAIMAVLGDDEDAKRRALSASVKPAYQVAKPGDVRVIRGVRYILQGDPPRWHRTDEEMHPAVAGAIKLAEELDTLHEGQADDAAMTRLRLQEGLDSWVATHGTPARNKHLRAWLAAPSMAPVPGMNPGEHGAHVHETRRRAARLLGAVGDDGSYSDLVTGTKRDAAGASLDTHATQLSLETGGFTVDQLAAATGRPAAEVLDHLAASGAYAVDPDGRTWSTLDTYLSGDLWPKFDAANAAARDESREAHLRRKWSTQAALLEAAIAPASLEDVEITFGSGFVTPDLITAWFQATHDQWKADNPHVRHPGPATPTFAYSEADAIWTAEGGAKITKLILASLNRTGVRKDDLPLLTRLQKRFADWLRSSDHRDAVEDRYNRTYRGFRPAVHADTPIAVPGLNPAIRVNNFHWSGLRWALEAGKGIVAADVGLGKTIRGLMLNRLLTSTGRAKKPAIVVPKSVMANWLASIETFFPGAKVLTIGETYSRDKLGAVKSKADDETTRRAKYHQLQQNDHDFVLISQPAWNDLDVSPERREEYEADDFWERRGEALARDKAKDKAVAKAKASHDQEMAAKKFRKREGTIAFDELGIDAVIMDEGHAYKNLYSAKSRFGESPKFLGGSGESKRAQDTFFKSKFIREQNGGKGVFMLTATPTKNSPLEVYSMLSHIAPEAFERMGIRNSEDFLDRFCEFENDTILDPGGELVDALVTAGFKNMGELREVMRRFIDRKTAEDVGLVIPRGLPVEHLVDMTPAQEGIYQHLREKYATAEGDATGDSHIFSIMQSMDKATIDLSLLSPGAGDRHMPKVDACVATAMEHAAEGGQVIFCDAKPVHEKIVAKLVAAGVPRSEIAIINADATPSSAARQGVCDAFNAGRVRYVIGNTATMGEGVNLQGGTTDIHHLDLPWEPASMQQRNGRGVRQGNIKEAVRLHSYLARKSFDGYRLQTIQAKKDWQDLLWHGGDRIENLARGTRPGRDDMLIMMSADPEAAAAKLASDKEAALAKRSAEERGKANEAFTRLNKMRVTLAKLREEKEPKKRQESTMVRLERKVHELTGQLGDMRGFAHRHLLDTDTPVLVEPVTNHAWVKGAGLDLAGGSSGPANFSPEPTKWVVTQVNPVANRVSVRRYGTTDTSKLDLDLDRMKEGVTPFDAKPDEEAKMIEAEKRAKAAEWARRDAEYRARIAPYTYPGR